MILAQPDPWDLKAPLARKDQRVQPVRLALLVQWDRKELKATPVLPVRLVPLEPQVLRALVVQRGRWGSKDRRVTLGQLARWVPQAPPVLRDPLARWGHKDLLV